ncbi:hypothetical protein EDB83DRAFT_2551221 [Lactarius deliciosus]|nr:hypothetical protein EDB83DRAFT_2551221 [Lactarius deliciosus]
MSQRFPVLATLGMMGMIARVVMEGYQSWLCTSDIGVALRGRRRPRGNLKEVRQEAAGGDRTMRSGFGDYGWERETGIGVGEMYEAGFSDGMVPGTTDTLKIQSREPTLDEVQRVDRRGWDMAECGHKHRNNITDTIAGVDNHAWVELGNVSNVPVAELLWAYERGPAYRAMAAGVVAHVAHVSVLTTVAFVSPGVDLPELTRLSDMPTNYYSTGDHPWPGVTRPFVVSRDPGHPNVRLHTSEANVPGYALPDACDHFPTNGTPRTPVPLPMSCGVVVEKYPASALARVATASGNVTWEVMGICQPAIGNPAFWLASEPQCTVGLPVDLGRQYGVRCEKIMDFVSTPASVLWCVNQGVIDTCGFIFLGLPDPHEGKSPNK